MISCHASPVAHLEKTQAWRTQINHLENKFDFPDGLTSVIHRPEEKQHGLWEGLEVVVSVNVSAINHCNLSKHLLEKHCQMNTAALLLLWLKICGKGIFCPVYQPACQ